MGEPNSDIPLIKNGPVAIAGLGNPGKRYEQTRHNIGADAVCRLAEKIGAGAPVGAGWRSKSDGLYCKCSFGGGDLYLILPQTFMNLSGEAVQPLLAYFKIAPENLVVVYDELDLNPGEVRTRFGGGSGGHNGLNSIVNRLGSPDFYRVRIGIGRPAIPTGADKGEIVSSWVLSRARGEELSAMERGLDTANQALECLLLDGSKAAQNRFNRRSSGGAA